MIFDAALWEARAFCISLVFYHLSEFLIALRYNGLTVSSKSLLLSAPYVCAMGFAVLEYCTELTLFPTWKRSRWSDSIKCVGLACAILGDCLRKAAEVTAATAFTHIIQTSKRPEHRVIKHGVYRYIRHPGYLGWFVWSVGTQILLCNPVSVVVFLIASLRFFKSRIPFEESALRRMFPGEYAAYAAVTKTWIPGIA